MSNDSSNSVPEKIPPQKIVVPWNPWWGVVFIVGVFFGSQLFSGSLLSIYGTLTQGSLKQAVDWMADSASAQFMFIFLTEFFSIGSVYLFLRHYKVGFASIGLRRPRGRDSLYGVAAVLPYFIVFGITLAITAQLFPNFNSGQKQEIGFENVQGGFQLALAFVSLVILPPLAEEIMMRGFLYSSFKKALPIIYAALFTSALFAIAHLPEGGASGPLYVAAIDTFVLSLFLIGLREKTGSLWASITLHAIKNGIAFVALFASHFK